MGLFRHLARQAQKRAAADMAAEAGLTTDQFAGLGSDEKHKVVHDVVAARLDRIQASRPPEQQQHRSYSQAIQVTETVAELATLEEEIAAWQATIAEPSPDYGPEYRV